LSIVARLVNAKYDNPIMGGAEKVPSIGQEPIAMTIFPILESEGSVIIANVNDEKNDKKYPGIVEKKQFPMGTVIYFNYDPGLTPTIMKNTLDYLK
jgi:hypothetical protein